MRFFFAGVLSAVCLPAAAQTMEPGNWLFTSTITSSLLPQPQTTTSTQCVSKEDASDPTRFTGSGQTANCKVTPGSRSSDSYNWTVSCPDQGMRGAGTARFGRGSIDSEMQMTIETGGQKMEMQTRTAGRLQGPCTAK